MKQDQAENILKSGRNVFLTGSAGSGKTYLLNKYIYYLKENKIKVGITASTGIASTHLDGRTIHSWCKIGIKDKLTKVEMKNIINNEHLWSKISHTKVLIIDEVSMLSASRLDLVDHICKAIRKDLRPFGGIQIVLCGDFFQLPPVARGKEDGRFITESEIWKDMNIQVCYLEEQFRQEDEKFIKVLSSIRENKVNATTYSILNKRLNKPIKYKIRPTILHALNKDVDAYNIFELNKLRGTQRDFEMRTEGVQPLVKSLKNGCLAHETLHLKIGTVVMFIKNNFSKKYVNGTLGKVIDFDADSDCPIVETISGDIITALPEKWMLEDGGETLASVYQVPLRLAWAITIHKSQGMSLDCAEIDLSRAFENGMGYVALSRVRSLDGIKLLGINESALQVNKEAIKLNKQLIKKSQKDLDEFTKLGKKVYTKEQKAFLKICKSNSLSGLFK
jgi:ATP-dependent exoDNAse (exonuclease V) alpha subunit